MIDVSYSIRVAVSNDVRAMQTLIAQSARLLSQKHYSEQQIEAAITHIFGVDSDLLNDKTYFVVEALNKQDNSKTMAACGGWSKRRTLFGGDQFATRDSAMLNPATDAAKVRAFFVSPDHAGQGVGEMLLKHCEAQAAKAGFGQAELMSTMPAVKFYARHGYEAGEGIEHPTDAGGSVPFVPMHKELSTKRSCCATVRHYKNALLSKRDAIKANSKKFFWAWIIYQAIKGTLTTAFIWIPLIWYWLEKQ